MLRLRSEQHRKIKKAAAISGETMSRFVYRSVMQKADAVLEEHDEFQLWDRMAPVGREFGSPDFERLMEEDLKNLEGVFAPPDLPLQKNGFHRF